ncbi:MAG: GNAT family N-acetyltransferase [Elusimicrobia bacterium]|nr:MAG: GNAT family N-acetyltransferase [Elusimicrobiota bacterium]
MPFDYQPNLKGELIELRPLRSEDYDALYAVASDPKVWEQHPANDRYQTDVFKELFDDALTSGGALVAIDPKTQRIIGSSRFHAYNESRSDVEIGWTYLATSYWGGQYNKEMKQLMLKHAFKFVDTVLFLIGPENIRSQRATKKFGGIHTGSTTNADGSESYVYELKREDFDA